MIRNVDYQGILFACLAMIIIYLIVFNFNNEKKRLIKNHPLIVTSTIKKIESAGYRGSYSRLHVEFLWKGKVIKTDFSSPNTECAVIGRELLLIVDSTNIENSRLLIKPEDFSEFNLEFPDSLSWTEDCFML